MAAGGVADMALIARERGGDAAAVGIVHALRVSMTVAIVPILVVSFGEPGTVPDHLVGTGPSVLWLVPAFATAVILAKLLKKTKLPNPWLVAPMLLGFYSWSDRSFVYSRAARRDYRRSDSTRVMAWKSVPPRVACDTAAGNDGGHRCVVVYDLRCIPWRTGAYGLDIAFFSNGISCPCACRSDRNGYNRKGDASGSGSCDRVSCHADLHCLRDIAFGIQLVSPHRKRLGARVKPTVDPYVAGQIARI